MNQPILPAPAPTLAFFPMDPETADLAGYTLKGRSEILERLNTLQKKQTLLTAEAAVGTVSFLTTIVCVRPDIDTLAVDASLNESQNKALCDAESVSFSGRVDGIFARFSSKGIKPAVFNGQNVLAAPFPESLFWLQRRQHYRVDVPYSMTLKCLIPLSETEIGEFEVLNLGLRGLAILDRTLQLDPSPEVGRIFKSCRFSTYLTDEIFSLETRYTLKTTVGLNDRLALRMGFAFRDANRAFEVHLQRMLYEFEMQKKRAVSLLK